MRKLASFRNFKKKMREAVADSDGEDLPDTAAKTKKKLKEPKNIETNGG